MNHAIKNKPPRFFASRWQAVLVVFMLTLGMNGQANASLNDGLVAYWSFDDCTAKDNSGNGHDAIINGNPQCENGSKGKALNFYNNSSARVENGLSMNVEDDITISTWVSSTATGKYSVWEQGTRYSSATLWVTATGMTMVFNWPLPQIIICNADYSFSTKKINHVVATYSHSNQEILLYANGVKIKSCQYNANIESAKDPITIAWSPAGDQEWFNGLIDELRIYNRALTDAEVTALYQQGTNTTQTITSITPTVAVLNQPTTFTVTGTNLTAGMGFTISDCDKSNEEVPGTGTNSQRQFQCTPHGTAGQKTGSVLKNLSGSSLYDFKVLYYDLSPDQYNIKLGGRITWPTTNSTTNFWEHRYWKPSEDRECFTSDKESTCATHTGRDTRLDRDGGKIKSYGFGQIKNIELGDRGCRLLSYISITHLLNNGETVQANLLHGNYDGSIQKNDYVVKQQSLGTESTKGACGSQHLHTEIASIPKLSWVYTSNAIPDLYGNRIPDENYQKDDLTAYYDKNRFDKKGLENPIYYSPDATFDKDKHSELLAWLAIDNLTPSFESGYSVYGIVNNPLYGQLNLKRVNSKLFKAIGILIKNGSDRNEANWLELADTNGKWLAKTWTGNMAYNDTLVVSANVSDNYPVANQYTYTQSGDYLAIPFVSETGTSTVKGYPVIFSILDNEKSKVIDNDKTIDNAKTTYLSSGIAKQRPGYYLTSDVAFGQSGATAKWLPNVAGNYKVSVFIPETTNSKVIYKVKTTGTTAQLACVIQDRTQGAWASLVWSAGDKDINGDGKMNVNDLTCVSGGSTTEPTQFNFSKNGYVVASLLKTSPMGNNSHLKSSDQVAFDAVKFEFVPQ